VRASFADACATRSAPAAEVPIRVALRALADGAGFTGALLEAVIHAAIRAAGTCLRVDGSAEGQGCSEEDRATDIHSELQ
jgi:hypothetical protein